MSPGQGGPTGSQPTDIYVHVVREGQQGASGTPGKMDELSSGPRSPAPPAAPARTQWEMSARGTSPETPGLKAQASTGESSMGQLLTLAKKWLPAMAGVTTVAGIIKKSSVFGSTMEMIMELISVIVDIVLLPFLLPLIKLMMPIMEPLGKAINWVVNTFMGGKGAEKELQEAGAPGWLQGVGKVFDRVPGGSLLWGAGKALVGGPEKKPGEGAFGGLLGGMTNAITSTIGSTLGAIPGIGGLFGGQGGVPYIPKDMPMMLHKGERVLTAAQNQGGGLGGPQMFNNKFDIHVANNVDATLLDQRIVERLETRLGNRMRRT